MPKTTATKKTVNARQLVDKYQSNSDRINEIADLCEKEQRERIEAETAEYNALLRESQLLQMKMQALAVEHLRDSAATAADASRIIRENVAAGRQTQIMLMRDLVMVADVTTGGIIPVKTQDILDPLVEGLILDKVGLPMPTGLAGDNIWPPTRQWRLPQRCLRARGDGGERQCAGDGLYGTEDRDTLQGLAAHKGLCGNGGGHCGKHCQQGEVSRGDPHQRHRAQDGRDSGEQQGGETFGNRASACAGGKATQPVGENTPQALLAARGRGGRALSRRGVAGEEAVQERKRLTRLGVGKRSCRPKAESTKKPRRGSPRGVCQNPMCAQERRTEPMAFAMSCTASLNTAFCSSLSVYTLPRTLLPFIR